MARPLHFITPDAIVEVTSRTIQGRLLLKPSEELNRLILGVIGRAMTLYPVKIFIIVVLSNHLQLILQTKDGETLSRFMNYVNSNIAKEAGRLHEWKEKFWGRRYRKIPILDEEALLARFRYLLAHGCKEGLVAKLEDWPGVNCIRALTKGEKLYGIWIDRTSQYRAKLKGGTDLKESDFQTSYEVPLTPLPCWAHLSSDEQRLNVTEMVKNIEAEAKAKREKEGREIVENERIENIKAKDPHSKPLSSAKSPAPLCHASSKELRNRFYRAYSEFVYQFYRAAKLWRDTLSIEHFPEHCFLPSAGFYRGAIATATS